jgi:hypothetical protein
MNSRQGLRTLFGLTAARPLERKLPPSFLFAALLIGVYQSGLTRAAPVSGPITSTLFRNVRIFDGRSAALSTPSNVLISGNIIERISASPITLDANADVQIVAGNGRVLMPGLSDVHWHAMMVRPSPPSF